jgi:hypothetical protein
MASSDLAPAPQFPERVGSVYETKIANGLPMSSGPLRFEEGLATDIDIPSEFQNGIMQGYATAPGRPNHNLNVYEKWPEETLRQRAHVGSAAWVEAPTFLSEFAGGADADAAAIRYQQVDRSGGRYERINPASVPN